MKISASTVGFNSQHDKFVSETLHSQRDERVRETSVPADGRELGIGASIDLSYEARMRSGQTSQVNTASTITSADDVRTVATRNNTASLVETVLQHTVSIEKESGLNFVPLQQLEPAQVQLSDLQAAEFQTIQGLAIEDLSGAALSGISQVSASDELNISISEIDIEAVPLRFNVEEAQVFVHEQRIYTEQETLNVASQGVITTEDGQEISFMMELEMAREFELEENFASEFESRTMIDPLVINLDGGSAGLSSGSFTFDLDADGATEEISFARQGSGFLALDKNADGQINDGSELFGTQGQNGFSDLAQYDEDGNRWIDENDAIFDELKIWTRDEQGNDQLLSLREAGVGAIYLGSTSSTFELKDDQNNSLGEIKRTGVFLMEDGAVGSIQELDLAIHGQSPSGLSADARLGNRIAEASTEFDTQAESTESIQIRVAGELPAAPDFSDFTLPADEQRVRISQNVVQESRLQSESSTEKSVGVDQGDEVSMFVRELDATRLEVMERLRSKTEIQIEVEQDRYAHLRSIIDTLKVQKEKAESISFKASV